MTIQGAWHRRFADIAGRTTATAYSDDLCAAALEATGVSGTVSGAEIALLQAITGSAETNLSGLRALALATYGTDLPVLVYDFRRMATMPSRWTFTRASSATYEGPTGPVTVADNVPRFTSQGLLVETLGSTNLLLNSATLSTQDVTVTAVLHSFTFYGTGTVTATGAASFTLVGTGAYPARVFQSFTPSAGTLTLTVSGSVQWAQLEAISYPSSWIPTTGAAATRVAEEAKITDAVLFGVSDPTMGIERTALQFSTSVASQSGSISSNANSQNRIASTLVSGSPAFRVSPNSATNTLVVSHAALSVGQVYRHAFTGTSGTWSSAVNGALLTNTIPSGNPVGMNTLYLGTTFQGGASLPMLIRRVCYWNYRLTDAKLTAWSAI